MPLRVVFTGKGSIRHPMQSGFAQSESHDRTEWERRARHMSWQVQTRVDASTDYLVASRADTKKAEDARTFGAEVISYDRFNAMYLDHDKPGGRFTGKCGPVPDRRPPAQSLEDALTVTAAPRERPAGWGLF